MRLRKSAILKELYLLILGTLGFSMLGQYVVLDVLHLPMALMEIYYIPLLFIYRKEIWRFLCSFFRAVTRWQALACVMALCSMIMGFGYTTGVSFILEYRSIIYMVLLLFFFRNKKLQLPVQMVQRVAMYTVASELLYIVLISEAEITSSMNCVAIAMSILAAFLCERYMLGLLSFVLGVFAGITSGFRIGIIIAVAALAEAIVFMLIRRDKRTKFRVKLKRAVTFFTFMVCVVIFLLYYEPIVMFVAELTGMSRFAVYRIVERMKGLISFDMKASQEDVRMEIFRYPFTRFLSNLLPRGLIGSLINEYWLYIDVPILYLYDIFGSLVAWGVVAYFAVMMLRRLKMVRISPPKGIERSPEAFQVLCVLMSPVMLCLLIFNGSFMVITFQAVQNAILLAGLCQKKAPQNQ